MILTSQNLRAGLTWWTQRGWDADLHAATYGLALASRALGLDLAWWSSTVPRLSAWRAFRSRLPPNSKAQIYDLGVAVLDRLEHVRGLVHLLGTPEPSIESSDWPPLRALYEIAFDIRPSPVFASKMCHLVFPNAFLPMDNLATGVMDYEFYWRGSKDEWTRTTPEWKAEATALLGEVLSRSNVPRPLLPPYPFQTKILELCHIGSRHPST